MRPKKPTIILYQYKGVVTHIPDGDGAICTVSLGFDVYKNLTIRMAKINAPELTSSDPEVFKAALASREFLSSLILNKTIYFNSKSYDKYKRSIAEIYLSEMDTISVNQMMVDKGMAVAKKY